MNPPPIQPPKVRSFSTDIHVTETQLTELLNLALTHGFSREYPRRQWLQAEQKRAIQYLTRYLISTQLDPST